MPVSMDILAVEVVVAHFTVVASALLQAVGLAVVEALVAVALAAVVPAEAGKTNSSYLGFFGLDLQFPSYIFHSKSQFLAHRIQYEYEESHLFG